MTLTALNIASIIAAVALVVVLVVVYLHIRRDVSDAEGAIAVIELDDLP